MARPPQPIARRLSRINLLATGAALLVAGGALVAYDFFSFRQTMARNLTIQAQIIGSNSLSALLFDDPEAATQTLAALSASPNVVAAAIFTPDGRLFAAYPAETSRELPPRPPDPPSPDRPHWFNGLRLELVHDVRVENRPLGRVYIQATLREALARLSGYVLIVLGVSGASLLAAALVSRAAQRSISRPVAALADVARQVSRDQRYAVRAPTDGQAAELTVLAQAFNDMLDRVEARDRELQAAHNDLETRVLQRTQELDAANKELEAFSYSVSHDLRAPLRHMTGFAELLRERATPVLDDEGRRYLRTITTAATRMGRLIDDLLAFSRMGRTPLVRSRVRLGALVEDVRAEVAAGADGREIAWHIDPALPDVEADPAMLRVALVNLLDNAVKYTSTRSRAEITIGARPGDQGDTIVFVRDNGVGFESQYVHKLFGVFQRLHRADEFEGTGIGLANVRRVIHRHGGEVWAEGEPDRGATFSFSLPPRGLPT